MLGKSNANLHKDDVVESTTSRPLHTVGTTLEADAAKQNKKKIFWMTWGREADVTDVTMSLLSTELLV